MASSVPLLPMSPPAIFGTRMSSFLIFNDTTSKNAHFDLLEQKVYAQHRLPWSLCLSVTHIYKCETVLCITQQSTQICVNLYNWNIPKRNFQHPINPLVIFSHSTFDESGSTLKSFGKICKFYCKTKRGSKKSS